MISRNRVPGWIVRAIRVPDFLKSLGCDLKRSCTRLASKSHPLNKSCYHHDQVISRNLVPGCLVRAIRVPDFLKSLGCDIVVKRIAFRCQPGTITVEIAAKWWQGIGYPDGLFEPTGYPISWNHLASMCTIHITYTRLYNTIHILYYTHTILYILLLLLWFREVWRCWYLS